MILTRNIKERDQRLEEALITQLSEEWADPKPAGEPIIIQESTHADQPPKHLYVVWHAWSGLSPLERSRIIMRAYERHLGDNEHLVQEVSVAMGLTPDEARKIGIAY